MKRSPSISEPGSRPAPCPGRFVTDLRAILVPPNKWHYAFHLVVILTALSYWIGSRLVLPQASWAEIALYRPGGDNQVWPVVTALSHFNFGDPTDALKYGQGVGGFHAVILLPHALAFAAFGPAGYMVMDVFYSWCYFVAAAMLFRCWGLSRLPSLVLSSAIATLSLQSLLKPLTQALTKSVSFFGRVVSEWDFPDLFNLPVGGKRIPRPFPTEILLVLLLYFLVRQWQDRRSPSLKRGIAIGALMGLIMQGDPFSFAALGLLCLCVLAHATWARGWRIPWRFIAGAIGGAAFTGWYFVVQMLAENPDGAVRFGLANYPRTRLLLLPDYAPWLRVFIALCLAMVIRTLVRRIQARVELDKAGKPRVLNSSGDTMASDADGLNDSIHFAWFAVAMIVCAWLAQPVQLLLLGKGAQIYHYFLYTLPLFFGYGLVLLLIRLGKTLAFCRVESEAPRRCSPAAAGWICACLLGAMLLLGVEPAADAIRQSGTSRQDMSPWLAFGDNFRPSLRAIDKEFSTNPALKNTRTFGTFCQEVNYLLTAFHGKRAYLPDNGFSTLSDRELEERLLQMVKICHLGADKFESLIQDLFTMNFWLGCAKYWCASDHTFAPLSDYAPLQLEALRKLPDEAPFHLALPHSEFQRLMSAYDDAQTRPADTNSYPDTLVLTTLLRQQGMTIDPALYTAIYTNAVFTIYTRTAHQ